MHEQHYWLIGERTEAILMDGHVFPKGALIEFSNTFDRRPAVDSHPSEIVRAGEFLTIDLKRGQSRRTIGYPVLFCVKAGSESEGNLMAAAIAQKPGDEALLYVKHADGSVYEFSVGRFVIHPVERDVSANFREVRQVRAAVYESLRGPRDSEGERVFTNDADPVRHDALWADFQPEPVQAATI
ncbi:hypothetical protein [Cupriavidus pauculus]|uniref:Uncharacterized protein n=1 Tax=Cupriavidus pauculus TaxID=82633 RepID=A0A2N5C9J4_9BURK|nr:hypothetical protein [Cupriavidus pauculus]PLP98886.1 hypothetical protein CYJ10_19045 [Cupriavidus pauculus]